MFKVASWNVNSLRVRLDHVLQWLEANQPDVVGLQELKLADEQFPVDAFTKVGYHAVFAGQKTYNGVAILSKLPPSEVSRGIPGYDDPQQRVIAATVGPCRVIDVYVPNGESVGSDKFQYKLAWLEALRSAVRDELKRYPRVALIGDFNIAPQDRDVHDPDAWREKILCSTPERDALNALLELGLRDTFRLFDQPEGVYSWWDYRMAAFRRNLGLRIDLILVSGAAAEACRVSSVDKAPRKLERPSDHAPVVAEFDF